MAFTIKDSGERQEFAGGMVRDTSEGKVDYTSVRFGPMYRRWAEHTTRGRKKYPDPEPGVPNWTLAEGVAEFLRARESYLRHSEAYLAGKTDEDHAAGIFFNVNLMEYIREQLGDDAIPFLPDVAPRPIDAPKPAEPAPLQPGDRVRLIVPSYGQAVEGDEGVIIGPDSYHTWEVVFDRIPHNPHYLDAANLERA